MYFCKALLLIIGFSLCLSSAANEDVFLNLEFDHFSKEGFPTNWYIEGAENAVIFQNEGSGNTKLTVNSESPLAFYVPVLVNNCIKSLEITMSFTAVEGILSAPLFINPSSNQPNVKPPQKGNNNLQSMSHTISFNGCAEFTPLFGFIVMGEGHISITKFDLKINGKLYNDPKPPKASSQHEIKEARNLAKIFNKGKENGFDKSISHWFNNKQVVGLGENSHGSQSLFEYKLSIIKHLIQDEDFQQVAVEMPSINALFINEYINGNSLTKEEILGLLHYPSWQNQTMLDLIEYLKQENLQRKTKLEFVGIDIQHPTLSYNALIDRLSDLNADLAIQKLKELKDNIGTANFNILESAKQIKQSIPMQGAYLQRFVDILIQGYSLSESTIDFGTRSKMMAEQLVLVSQSKKTVVWADNTHISKKGPEMGYYITQAIGQEYLAVGFTFHEGFYAAYGPNNPYPANKSPNNSHEFLLQAIADQFLIRLADLPEQHSLHAVREFRYIGSRPQTYSQFYPHRLSEHFDIVGFVKSSKAIEYLVEHDF